MLKPQTDEIPYSSVAWLSIPKCCNEDSLSIANSLQDQNINFLLKLLHKNSGRKQRLKELSLKNNRRKMQKSTSAYFSPAGMIHQLKQFWIRALSHFPSPSYGILFIWLLEQFTLLPSLVMFSISMLKNILGSIPSQFFMSSLQYRENSRNIFVVRKKISRIWKTWNGRRLTG